MNEFLYSVDREYPVSIETLWNAWTDSSILEKWYFPTMLAGVPGTFKSDARVGGQWTAGIDVSANGFNAYFWGTYTEVEPLRHLAHTLSYSQDENEFRMASPDAPAHLIHLDFESRGTSSWVKFTQFGQMPAEQIEATRMGMSSYFDSLENYLASV